MSTAHPAQSDTVRFAALTFIALAAALLFLGLIQNYLIALFLAAVTAASSRSLFILLTERLKNRPHLAAAIILTALLLFLVVPVIALAFMLADQASTLADYAGPWIEQQIAAQQSGPSALPDWVPFRETLQEYLAEILVKVGEFSGSISQFILKLVSSITSSIASFFIGLVVFFYAVYYFLLRGPELLERITVFNTALGGIQESIFERGLSVSQATIKGTLVLGVIQGIIGGIGFALFDIPGPILWGTVMAVASFIPMIGTAIIWIPGVIYLTILGDMYGALGLALYSAIILGNIENLLRPIIVGRDAKLSDLMVLISTFGGLTLFGAAGIILGPVTAAICISVFEAYADNLKRDVKASDL